MNIRSDSESIFKKQHVPDIYLVVEASVYSHEFDGYLSRPSSKEMHLHSFL